MKKEDCLIKVEVEGEVGVHILNIGPTDHVTACGLDGGLTEKSQRILPLERGDKMDCSQCLVFYENRKKLNIDKRWIKKSPVITDEWDEMAGWRSK